MKKTLSLVFALATLSIAQPASLAQALYSYVDESGVQVFTNVPPVGRVSNLEVTGKPEVPNLPPPPPSRRSEQFGPIIEKYAAEHNLDPSLIRSIIAQESGFNPNAVSPKGARGLMQLMPATAARLGVTDSFDPEQNIRGGIRHFRRLMDNFNNDLTLSLAAYNAGENLVQRLGRVPAIKETRDYVKSITEKYGKLDANVQAAGKSYTPPYRFVDESGTLHLTNIPPVR